MKGKKLLLGAGAAALVAALSVGGTLAYLSAVTETKQNVFSSSRNLSGSIEETEWDEESGSEYLPGKVIGKNPSMVNTSDTAAYVAISLDVTDGEGKAISLEDFRSDYAEFLNSAGEAGMNTGWKQVASNGTGELYVLYAGDNLAETSKNVPTEALFEAVRIKYGIRKEWNSTYAETSVYEEISREEYDKTAGGRKEADGKYYRLVEKNTENANSDSVYYVINDNKASVITDATTLPTFNINVKGYMTQSGTGNMVNGQEEKVEKETALDSLKEMAGF